MQPRVIKGTGLQMADFQLASASISQLVHFSWLVPLVVFGHIRPTLYYELPKT